MYDDGGEFLLMNAPLMVPGGFCCRVGLALFENALGLYVEIIYLCLPLKSGGGLFVRSDLIF